jgi:trimeric autotransporter adhesin
MPERGRSHRARVVTAAGISAAVLVAGGGAVSYATSQNSTTPYVTATAGSHSVLQSLQATGTTEPSSAATVSFAVSGTVATVPVTMGQKVSAGQVLATLDSASLKYALATAQGQVANANLTLVQAESGQVSAVSGGGGKPSTGSSTATGSSTSAGGSTGTGGATSAGGSTSSGGATAASTRAASTGTGNTKTSGAKTGSNGTGATTGSSGSTHSVSASTAPITTAQKTLLATVRQADALLAKTTADLGLATTLCTTQTATPPTPTPIPTLPPTPTPTPSPTPTPTTPPTTATPTTPTPATPTPTPTSGKATVAPAALTTAPSAAHSVAFSTTSTGSTTCIPQQQLVLHDESRLLTLQQGLSTQESSLDKLITRAAASTGSSTGKTSTGTAPIAAAPAGTSSTGTSSAGKTTATGTSTGRTAASGTTTGGSGATTVIVSAAQLAADQSAVDAADANLTLAEQQLSQATIVSPFTGVVSSVGLTVGQEATAGSSTSAVDVIDPTGHGVTVPVDVTKIPQIKVGDKATVVPDGSSVSLAATVSYVAAAPTTSGSTAYTVQLAFTANPTTLRDGLQTAVTITTSQAVNALAVPTSAVNHRGSLSYVLLPNGATTRAQIITVGSVGAIYTQVTGGLTTGQRVVLANPNTPIPTSTISGRIARITGGVASGTAGVLGGSSSGTGGAGGTGTRTGG